jgi:hypothetical protein
MDQLGLIPNNLSREMWCFQIASIKFCYRMLRNRENAHENTSPQEKVRHISIVTRLLTGRT